MPTRRGFLATAAIIMTSSVARATVGSRRALLSRGLLPVFPADLVTTWTSAFGLVPMTKKIYNSSFSTPQPCFDYILVDGAGTTHGTGTINFINGALDVTTIRQKIDRCVVSAAVWASNQITFTVPNTDAFDSTNGGPFIAVGFSPPGYNGNYKVVSKTAMTIVVTQNTNPGNTSATGTGYLQLTDNNFATLNDSMTCVYQMAVTKWYDQIASNHFTQGTLANCPLVGVVNGQAHIVYGQPGTGTGFAPVLTNSLALGTQAMTIAGVYRPLRSYSPGGGHGGVFFGTSLSGSEFTVVAPDLANLGVNNDGGPMWQLSYGSSLSNLLDRTGIQFKQNLQAITVSGGSSALEVASDNDIFSGSAFSSSTGNGVHIGGDQSGVDNYMGWCDGFMAATSALTPTQTAAVRANMQAAFGFTVSDTHNVVVEGDSGTHGFGSLLPLIPGSVRGLEGYSLTMKLMDDCARGRWNCIGANNSGFSPPYGASNSHVKGYISSGAGSTSPGNTLTITTTIAGTPVSSSVLIGVGLALDTSAGNGKPIVIIAGSGTSWTTSGQAQSIGSSGSPVDFYFVNIPDGGNTSAIARAWVVQNLYRPSAIKNTVIVDFHGFGNDTIANPTAYVALVESYAAIINNMPGQTWNLVIVGFNAGFSPGGGFQFTDYNTALINNAASGGYTYIASYSTAQDNAVLLQYPHIDPGDELASTVAGHWASHPAALSNWVIGMAYNGNVPNVNAVI